MEFKVVPVDAENKDDFYKIHCDENDAGWCYCVAWWTTTWDAWGLRTAEGNRIRRDQIFEQSIFDGYLLYSDGKPIGWCQCAPRDYFIKLLDQYKLPLDPDMYAISCFFIIPEFREIGLAHHFISEILKDLARQSIKSVQAFPKRGENLAPDNVWTGPESVFQKAEFDLQKDDPSFPVYIKHLK